MQNPARKHVLADVRLACGLTQSGLAELLDCHPMTVQKIEQGALGMSPKIAARVSEVLDVDQGWLLANNFIAPPITREGGPWQKGHYELAMMNSTAWGRIAQTPPLPKHQQEELAELGELYLKWKTEELSATLAASISGAKAAGASRYGIHLFHAQKVIDELAAREELDLKVLEERTAQIDKYRKPYLELLARLEKRTSMALGPSKPPKSRSRN